MKFQFIEDHRREFPIIRMCEVLEVSRSGYYAWRDRPPSAREMANQALYTEIKRVYTESHQTYGSPRIYQALQKEGVACSENRVARLMRAHDLQAEPQAPYHSTTQRNATDPVAPNSLARNFTAERPDEKWLTDITYIPTAEGWLYLAVVLDLYSRRIIGWAMAARMTGDLTLRALRMALQERQPKLALLHHSDQGSQYTAGDYQQLLADWDIQVSMNGVGSWYDNAPMESFFGTLKQEWVHPRTLRSHEEARTEIFYYIEGFYNQRRLHSALDYCSPAEYEQRYYQEQ
jgi:transposase InsO family protein